MSLLANETKNAAFETESDADMIQGDATGVGEDDGSRLAFGWKTHQQRYSRVPRRDVAGS